MPVGRAGSEPSKTLGPTFRGTLDVKMSIDSLSTETTDGCDPLLKPRQKTASRC